MTPAPATPAAQPAAPAPPVRVAVVIPTYNRRASLLRCLASVAAADREGLEVTVCVVDDGSGDGTAEAVAALAHSAPVEVRCEQRANAGPAAARNHGVAVTEGEWVAFTDDDCEVDSGWLRALCRPLWPAATGGVAGRILSAEGRGLVERYCRWSGYNQFPRGKRPPRVLHFLNTANCAYRRAALEAVSGFDLAFSRIGYEDVDLSRRVQLSGWGFEYQPAAEVLHHHREDLRGLWAAYHKRGRATTLIGALWRYEPVDRRTVREALREVLGAGPTALAIPLEALRLDDAAIRDRLGFAALDWWTGLARDWGAYQTARRLVRGELRLERTAPVPPYEGTVFRALKQARQAYAETTAADRDESGRLRILAEGGLPLPAPAADGA